MTKRALWLATRDLRIQDNPSLREAALHGEVLCLFVLDEKLTKSAKIGLNRLAFLFESLTDLREQLRGKGSELFFRCGNYESEVLSFAKSAAVDTVHMTRDYSGYSLSRASGLRSLLAKEGISLELHSAMSIIEPGALSPKESTYYKVFTPYYKIWEQLPRRPLLSAPSVINGYFEQDPGSIMTAEELKGYLGETFLQNAFLRENPLGREKKKFLLHLSPNRSAGGERKALEQLATFISSKNLFLYQNKSNDLESDSTSRLSSYLHFGCISPLSAEKAVLGAYADFAAEKDALFDVDREKTESALSSENPELALASVKAFLRQLCWRDFYLQFAAGFPALGTKNYREPPHAWNTDLRALTAWMNGETGEDIVDAAMHQLLKEGFVHNRARLIASSYLSKTLKIDWRHGLSHYDSLLTDADFSSDAGNWQWMAGTGTDTRPNRTLSPQRQQERFDPNAHYRNRYLPGRAPFFSPEREQRLF